MRIKDFTRPGHPEEERGAARAGQPAGAAGAVLAETQQAPRAGSAGAAHYPANDPEASILPKPAAGVDPLDCAAAKIALLQARLSHLEAVLEAARALMTSNQERLLRRLHDVPREIAALTAQLDRLSAGPAACAGSAAET